MPLRRTPVKNLSKSFHLTPVTSTPFGRNKTAICEEIPKSERLISSALGRGCEEFRRNPNSAKREKAAEENSDGPRPKTKMEELDTLVHKRGMAKGKLTKMLHSLHAPIPHTTASLKVYQKKVDAAYEEYHQANDKILPMVTPAEREEHDINYTVFDDLHMQIMMVIEEKMEQLIPPTQVAGSPLQVAPAQGTLIVKNPLKIPIPTIDGKYENWNKFKVMFKDLVDKTTDPPAVKLYHLDKALVGSASGIIDAKTINEGNYQHAWKLLEERYENLRHMVDTHIHGLFNLKKMTGEKLRRELRALVDECSRHVENLKFLKQEFTGVSEQFVVHLLTNALDKETRRRFENTVTHGALPTYEAAIKFLKEQAFIMERCESSAVVDKPDKQSPVKQPAGKPAHQSLVTTSSSETSPKCDFCGDSQHKNFKCSQFLAMSVAQRLEKVREKRVCFNCLRKGHPVASCLSTGTCSKCKRKHNTLLHFEPQQEQSPEIPESNSAPTPAVASTPESNESTEPNQPSSNQVTTAACSSGGQQLIPHVLLMTAVVDILDKNGNPHPCRVLLDSASQINLITKNKLDLLGLVDFDAEVAITGVDGIQSQSKRGVTVQLRSKYVGFRLNLQCLVSQRITADLPTSPVDFSGWNIPAGIELADPEFHSPNRVDVLIGNQWFLKLLMTGKVELAEDLPILCETKFGWVFGGEVSNVPAHGVVCTHATTVSNINENCQRDIESVPQQFEVSTEEKKYEKHIVETHQRSASGRYVIQLPLKEEENEPGDFRSLTLRRFLMLERFEKQLDLNQQYVEFIPRRVVAPSAIAFDLRGFGDASDGAHGACVYIRSLHSDGTATMQLICANFKPVLAWLTRPPEQLEVFVRNRVFEIQRNGAQIEWRKLRRMMVYLLRFCSNTRKKREGLTFEQYPTFVKLREPPSYDEEHQVVQPHQIPEVISLIRTLHREHLHVGPSGVRAVLRQQVGVTSSNARGSRSSRLLAGEDVRALQISSKKILN